MVMLTTRLPPLWIVALLQLILIQGALSFQASHPPALLPRHISTTAATTGKNPFLFHQKKQQQQILHAASGKRMPQIGTPSVATADENNKVKKDRVETTRFRRNRVGHFIARTLKRLRLMKPKPASVLQLPRPLRSLQRKITTFAVACMFFLVASTSALPAGAVTGSRMGGSFGPSSTSSSKLSPPPRSSSSYSRPQVRVYNTYSPPIRVWMPRVYAPRRSFYGGEAVATRFSASDVVVLTGTGALVAYGLANGYRGKTNRDGGGSSSSGPLGPGATATAVTVCLQVPNRDDPNCILNRLRRLSERVDTRTRKGVQDLVSEVSLELLRQERSVVSASTESQHFLNAQNAEREFQRRSVKYRGKFDRERVSKFGGDDRSEMSQRPRIGDNDVDVDPKFTAAIVCINLAIEGDSTSLRSVRSRQDLLDALSKIASDSQVGECLLSAEILWAPEEPWEVLTSSDIYADYPNLIPL